MKKLLFLLLLILGAYLLWRWWRSDVSVARGQELFYDRLWVDHMPKNDTDTIQVLVAVTEQPVGIFQAASTWKGQFEIFRYEPHGDGELVLLYPQTRSREKARYRAWKCGERSFDFCLDVDGASRGVKRYYSLEGWEIGSHRLAEARAEIQHLVDFSEQAARHSLAAGDSARSARLIK